MSHTTRPHLAKLGKFPALDVTTVEGLSHQQKQAVIAIASDICRKLMEDLGVKWKSQPIDKNPRRRTIDWIQTELEPLDAGTERAKDDAERKLASEYGFGIPLPLDDDRVGAGDSASGSHGDYLVSRGWPLWPRGRSAVVEIFAITTFRGHDGIDLPTWLWVMAISELRTVILAINDLLSFAKEVLANDTTSSISVLTKKRRIIGMPGSAPDGDWCLRDLFGEVFGKIAVAGSRINRLLRPTTPTTRIE
ncbi:hypothetical protein B0H67DRAFT_675923 [Lasiosphaeris hirsuta]|uniref:Uncharacterized protein n=1 Tax=Lasiosphaeris hirsuta TaxID=260670 RepID=A0AA39ZSE4_9PEZI|nr:hypothetical protein B0H67DRAFT_675923 [Lasiosphaeris hirsuta]